MATTKRERERKQLEERGRFMTVGEQARTIFNKDHDRVCHVLVAMKYAGLGKVYRGNLDTVARQIVEALDTYVTAPIDEE